MQMRDVNGKVLFWLFVVFLLLCVITILSACSAKVGPGEHGWMMWDVCGYEGGVAAEITIMQAGARLGCTNPETTQGSDEEVSDEREESGLGRPGEP